MVFLFKGVQSLRKRQTRRTFSQQAIDFMNFVWILFSNATIYCCFRTLNNHIERSIVFSLPFGNAECAYNIRCKTDFRKYAKSEECKKPIKYNAISWIFYLHATVFQGDFYSWSGKTTTGSSTGRVYALLRRPFFHQRMRGTQ